MAVKYNPVYNFQSLYNEKLMIVPITCKFVRGYLSVSRRINIGIIFKTRGNTKLLIFQQYNLFN